jgi:hypothetical protein
MSASCLKFRGEGVYKSRGYSDGTTFDPVTDDDVQGVAGTTGGIILALKTAHADPTITKVGYVGNRRYLKLLADFSGTHGTGTPLAATLVKGNPSEAPVA